MKVTEHVERLLRQGRKPKELIQLGFPKSVVTRVKGKLKKEEGLKKAEAAERLATTRGEANSSLRLPDHKTVMAPKLEFTETQWKQINNLLNTLPELAGLMAAIRAFGIEEREVCGYEEDGICTFLTWDSRSEIPEGIGEPVPMDVEKHEWHVKPSVYYCALCTTRVEDRLDRIEEEASDIPLWKAREQYSCRNCGNKGWIAIPVKCTHCGHETYWGWFPNLK